MEKNAPENVFGIADQKDISSANKGMNVESSEEKPKEDLVMETKDMSLDDLKEYLQKNNVVVNEQNIQNYYNQIVENKKYVNEYNQAIKELEDVKKDFISKNEEKGGNQNPDRTFVSKLSELEKRLADLNVEKQKSEDGIKTTINNIFNENKTENSENVNFETKNNVLNMSLKGVKKPVVSEKKEEVENVQLTPQVEKVVEEKQVPRTPQVEKVVEEKQVPRTPQVEKVVEEKEVPTTQENKLVEEKEVQLIPKVEKVVEEKEVPTIRENEVEPPISNIKKIETETKKEEKTEETSNNKGFAVISEEMKKGFESVLSAIQGISKAAPQETKKEQPKEEEPKKEQQGTPSANAQDKPKNPQKNYIEEYRQSLRSNAPIDGLVGIKGLHLKANNIGSFV